MKVPVPIRKYADFECSNQPRNDPNILFKQIPTAVGYYLIAPVGNQYIKAGCAYFSYVGTDCVILFVNEMLTQQHEANNYFETNIPN